MDDGTDNEQAVFEDDPSRGSEVEEDYDMMFGPGAYRWAHERALRRLRGAQAHAVAEVERLLREQGCGDR